MVPPGGAASLSACSAKNRNAAVKIGIYLTLNGNRRVPAIQFIDWMPLYSRMPAFGLEMYSFRAMLRSDSPSLSLLSRPAYEQKGKNFWVPGVSNVSDRGRSGKM